MTVVVAIGHPGPTLDAGSMVEVLISALSSPVDGDFLARIHLEGALHAHADFGPLRLVAGPASGTSRICLAPRHDHFVRVPLRNLVFGLPPMSGPPGLSWDDVLGLRHPVIRQVNLVVRMTQFGPSGHTSFESNWINGLSVGPT